MLRGIWPVNNGAEVVSCVAARLQPCLAVVLGQNCRTMSLPLCDHVEAESGIEKLARGEQPDHVWCAPWDLNPEPAD
jgi:hypothetical protein